MKRFLVVAFLLITSALFADNIAQAFGGEDKVINKSGYSAQWSEVNESPIWVGYELAAEDIPGDYPRENHFYYDESGNSTSGKHKDYTNSGYDRGHLAPAADMAYSEQAEHDSFSCFNISPQKPRFNRGIWKKLEIKVRALAEEYGTIYVITGPIFDYESDKIGETGLSVPDAFFKAVLTIKNGEYIGIGFIMDNEASKEDLSSFTVPIDEIENRTGLDLFYLLDNDIEAKAESMTDYF